MLRSDENSGSGAYPGEAAPGFDLGHFPESGRKLRLSHSHPRSNREWARIELLGARDGVGPFVPALDITHDRPDSLWWSGDINAYRVVSLHSSKMLPSERRGQWAELQTKS